MLMKMKQIVATIFTSLGLKKGIEIYDFNKSNPLGGGGERVDFEFNETFDFSKLDMYQKNHFKRYQFAKDLIDKGNVCGDFACGTGYGSVIISDKASKVIGVDLDKIVIETIKFRYSSIANVSFINENLLNLTYNNLFDTIISFETVEHFKETDIERLFALFSKALKPGGKLIFSTPFMQERSEVAEKLGFHLTFFINEEKINKWLADSGFALEMIKYQNYDTHNIQTMLSKKEFIICVAKKKYA